MAKINKKQEKEFFKSIRNAHKQEDPEKAVEKAVNTLIYDYFNSDLQYGEVTLSYPHNTDGLVSVSSLFFNFNILIETKRNYDFTGNDRDVKKAIAQVIYYLKKFQESGEPVPNATVIADNNEIFVVNNNVLGSYLNKDYDWSIAPSSAWDNNDVIREDLINDKNIHPSVKVIDSEAFDVNQFMSDVDRLAQSSTPIKATITPENLEKLFINFSIDVFGGVGIVSNQKQIETFIRVLKGDDNIFVHPRKKDTLMIDSDIFNPVNTKKFEYFWENYDSNNYSLKELKAITEIADTLLETLNRAFYGDFWTSTNLTNKAHNVISNSLGDSWRDDYVVWDMAAGAKNLTRDYKFKNLYSSTLHAEELSIASGYNKDNVSFQYDYLNDDMWLHDEEVITDRDHLEELIKNNQLDSYLSGLGLERKIPLELLQDLLDKKPFVAFTNPPYGQATDQDGAKKTGISKNSVNDLMKNLGHAKLELYTQFMYRTKILKEFFNYGVENEFHVAYFTSAKFIPSPSFKKFNDDYKKQFIFDDGFLVNAGEFNGTSSAWGIVFTMWKTRINNTEPDKIFDVLMSNNDGVLNKINTWVGKSVGKNDTISNWLNEITIGTEIDKDYPLTKNGFDAPTAKSIRCKMHKNWIGYLHNNGSNVQYSEKYTGFYSLGFSGANGRDITKDNFTRSAVTYSIRRSVFEKFKSDNSLWYHWEDVFKRPTENLLTDEFINDCVIYSLFSAKSKQTSLRNYEYKGKTYRVENEFFPFSKQFIEDLAVQHNNLNIQEDLDTDNERFVYEYLQDKELSLEAQELLDYVKKVYEESFKYRNTYAQLMPKYNTNSWDAGFIQVSRMIWGQKDKINDDLIGLKDEFKTKLKTLGDKIAKQAINDGVI